MIEQIAEVKVGKKRDGSDLWTFPIEPKVSVRGANEIVFRNVAKNRSFGSIKELWAQGDWEIVISGVFINEELDADGNAQMPEAEIIKLNSLFTAGQSLVIECPLLYTLGIDLIVIRTLELPETPGVANQRFSISAVSDFDFELLLPNT